MPTWIISKKDGSLQNFQKYNPPKKPYTNNLFIVEIEL